MGWTATSKKITDPVHFLIHESGSLSWNHHPPEQRPRVVASCRITGGYAFAVEYPRAALVAWGGAWHEAYEPDANGAIRAAVIILVDRTRRGDGYNFAWKDMGEGCGPGATAPASFLRHLSPLKPDHPASAHARDWRAGCKAASEAAQVVRKSLPKVTEGTAVLLARPIRFTDGVERQRFVITRREIKGRMRTFYKSPDGMLCAFPAKALIGATIGATA